MSVSIEHPTDKVNFTIVHFDGNDSFHKEHFIECPLVSGRSIAFSYQTIIGVTEVQNYKWILRENEWGPTTGNHLNYLSEDKDSRLSSSKFEELLEEIGL